VNRRHGSLPEDDRSPGWRPAGDRPPADRLLARPRREATTRLLRDAQGVRWWCRELAGETTGTVLLTRPGAMRWATARELAGYSEVGQ
jgi:hypothetical protein